jgi:WD40 repeat protein
MGFDVHRAPNSPSSQNSPGGTLPRTRSKGAKDRIRVLNCVALSPDQSWIAGGEKGYAPRVVIFPNPQIQWPKNANAKVHALTEHSDGIRCMAFSPCNQFLVSVGTVHDQCIIVYKYSGKNGWIKVAAAKFKDIIDAVVWCKRRIVTVGRRHLRVWEWHENSVHSILVF